MPDHAAQRGRLADRAAGVGAEGQRGEAGGHGGGRSARRAARAPGSRSQGLRVGPKAEFSVEEPMANSSMLVLPIEHRAGAPQPARPRWRRRAGRQPSRIFERAGGRDPAGAQVVLQRHRHPGQRARVQTRPHHRIDGVGIGLCRLDRHLVEAVQVTLEVADTVERLRQERPGTALARTDRGGDLDQGRELGGPARRHGASPIIRGTWKQSSSASGAWARTVALSRLAVTASSRSTFSTGNG